MPIELYQFEASPPCRMVRLLAGYMEIEMEMKTVDVTKGEQMEADFLQLNPLHTIPTLVDDGFILTESRAILMYLVNKYGDADSSVALYPTDPDKRAIVDMRIFFELATLYVRFLEAYAPVIWQRIPMDPVKFDKLNEALGYTEAFLKDGFIAGSELSIADFAVAVTLSTLGACGHDFSDFPEITAYLEKCAGLMTGWDEVNMVGANMFGQFFKDAIAEVEAK